MDLEMEQVKDNLIVRLQGELDHHSAGELRHTLVNEWEKDLAVNIVFNLKNLKFMDSSGIGVIMGRHKQVQERGGKVALCGMSPDIAKVIELSGLPKLVEVYRSEEEALRVLN